MGIRAHLIGATLSGLVCLLGVQAYPETSTVTISALASAVIAILLTWVCTKREVYDLDHAVLNIRRPDTMWLNMGYWKSTAVFAEACEALARELGHFSSLGSDDRVLDVGHGCGESLVVWARDFGVSRITGVTSLASHNAQAEYATGSAFGVAPNLLVDLHVADAVKWCAVNAQTQAASYDKILALDCVYHFRDKIAFLQSSYSLLGPGGKIAMTDLVLPPALPTGMQGLYLRAICLLAGVPRTNLQSESAYRKTLEHNGYTHVEMRDISEHVFNGLATYIEGTSSDMRTRTALNGSILRQYLGFSKVLRYWAQGNMKFMLVKASRGARNL